MTDETKPGLATQPESPKEVLLRRATDCDRAIVKLTTDPRLLLCGGNAICEAIQAAAAACEAEAERWGSSCCEAYEACADCAGRIRALATPHPLPQEKKR